MSDGGCPERTFERTEVVRAQSARQAAEVGEGPMGEGVEGR